MTDQKHQRQVSRRRHLGEFKTEVFGLVEQVGVSGAAKQLGLQESQLYVWAIQDVELDVAVCSFWCNRMHPTSVLCS